MTEIKQGKIKAISTKTPGKYSVNLGDDMWYAGFGYSPCQKGDEVKIEYVVNGNWKNIIKLEVTKKSEIQNQSNGKADIGESARLRRRTDCLICAKDFVLGKVVPVGEMLDKAQAFVDWVEGTSQEKPVSLRDTVETIKI